ncbi:hypothetical protein FB451DRAFT_1065784 [Mycena latifolia]|nr:hypothetical protein FB451DRAFT_1065784 [Mycena latifolia]
MVFRPVPLVGILCAHISAGLAHHSGPLSTGPSTPEARSHYQAVVIAHALICVLGFAILLPAGALVARYMRTFRPWWYTAHWIAQFGIAGPVILIGVILGYLSSSTYRKTAGDDHKTWGTIILALYFIQCALGAVIHYIKPKNVRRRPPQNYLHAILGIVVMILGMYQIHTGYDDEWPRYVGFGALPTGVNALWIVWCVLLVLAYAAGLYFIRKQYRQEAAARATPGIGYVAPQDNQYKMSTLETQGA